MKVVIAGNPNAGKTTLFNALTGSNLRTGNFHGVTTSPARKKKGGATYVDVPGAYAFSTYSLEEKSALDEIASADVVINAVDSLTLENSLNFTRRLIAQNGRTAVYLTKTDRLRRRGGRVNAALLSAHLGAPVFDCPPKALKRAIERGIDFNVPRTGTTLAEAYSGGSGELSRADKLFSNNLFSLIFFAAAMILTFFAAFHPAMPGAALKGLAEELICVKLAGAVTSGMQNAALASLVGEGIFGGAGSVLSFIPQLAVLYTALILLDESGIMSALAFTTDGLFEKVNLSGRAAFSLVSGFGCTAAAISTTRGFVSPAAQRRPIAILPYVPCGAKLPVFLTFLSPLFENPFPVIACLYFAGLAVALAASAAIGGGGEGMLSEIAPVVLPDFKTCAIKLFFQLKGFIIKVAGTVTAFCVAFWALSHFSVTFEYVSAEKSMLAALSRFILPLFAPLGVHDWRIACAAIGGFAAKENIAATLSMLCPEGHGLGLAPAMGFCTFVLLSPACISAFASSCREAGFKFSLKCVLVQLAFAFLGGYLVHFIFLL